MIVAEIHSRSATVIRWIARVWTILVLTFVCLRIIVPDPSVTGPVPLEDLFLLGLWAAAAFSLLIAWKWESIGARIVVGILVVREIAWVVLKGRWYVNFLLVWLVLVPPAVMFLAARRVGRASEQSIGM